MNIRVGEFGADAIGRLHDTIKEFNQQSQKQTQTMIRLTWAIAVLTCAMLVGLGVQIYLTWPTAVT